MAIGNLKQSVEPDRHHAPFLGFAGFKPTGLCGLGGVWIREASKGLLIIKTDSHECVSQNKGQASEILALKHTVHTSDRSETNANMIHMTQDYANGTTKETHLLSHAVPDGTFAPIYQRLVADPRNRPTVAPHPKDTIISLVAYDPGETTMIYGLWLSSAAAVERFPSDRAYSTLMHPMGRFSISVAYGFYAKPSTKIGFFLHYGTANPETLTEFERKLGYRTGVASGAEPEELPRYIIHELNEVIDLFNNVPFEAEMMRQKTVGILRPPAFLPASP